VSGQVRARCCIMCIQCEVIHLRQRNRIAECYSNGDRLGNRKQFGRQMVCCPSLREDLITRARMSYCSCTGQHGGAAVSTAASQLQGLGFDSSNFSNVKNKRRKMCSKVYVDGETNNGLFIAQPNSERPKVRLHPARDAN